MLSSSVHEGGSFAAGIVVPNAMNAAAVAALQTSAGLALNGANFGAGYCVREDEQRLRSEQDRIPEVTQRSETLQNNGCPEFVFGLFKPEEISLMLPKFSGETGEDVSHFIAILENTKRALNVNEFVMKLVVIQNLEGKAKVWMHSQADFS